MTAKKTVTVEVTAEDRKAGMTLDELATFVREAHGAEIDGSATVEIVSTWRGGIRDAKVTG